MVGAWISVDFTNVWNISSLLIAPNWIVSFQGILLNAYVGAETFIFHFEQLKIKSLESPIILYFQFEKKNR